MKSIIVIPARYESQRLEGKLLLPLAGKPMLQHVFDNLKSTKDIAGVYIATDSEKIKKIAEAFGAPVVMTSKDHISGTDRIAEAVQDLECDYVINVQGDEPLVNEQYILPLLQAFKEEPLSDIFTLYEDCDDQALFESINDVKLIADLNENAMYFSRLPIPYHRESKFSSFRKHIGVYAFKKPCLLQLSQLNPSRLELKERLEQLRWIEHGYNIKTIKVKGGLLSVDTEEDYQKIKSRLEKDFK